MLNGRGMAVFRQMRTSAMFATVPQKWDTARTFASPPKNPITTQRGVVAIMNEDSETAQTGYVAASKYALRDIAAMSAPKAEDRLIEGVPYVVRRQAAKALAEHVNDPQKTGGRYSLPRNTGPTGSGKVVLQRQNMLQVARDFGFLAVEIEFNTIQPHYPSENKANFARLVANRILCYLPKYSALEWWNCLKAIAQDFEWKAESPLDDVTQAVGVLKKALNHEGPVLIAVDELAMAPGCGKSNLTDLRAIMDSTLRGDNDNNKILFAVPVYDLVDLGTVATGSKDQLVQSTAARFATVTQKWDMTALTFSSPSKKPFNTERGVIAISDMDARPATTGYVAASKYALRDIAAMSAPKAEDRLIEGVPYVERRQAAKALAEHINDPQNTGGRYSLPCNTGPKGLGKTVLQRQNMLQVARDFGFLAVEIEFNAIQTISGELEDEANFARLVANRILCYLPKYCALGWSECLEAITEDFEWKAKSPLGVVADAVEVLKEALNHNGPVLLAVDELAMAPGCGTKKLTDLCAIMDKSLGKANANQRILPVVSVYTLVDLGDLVTESGRNLVHQKLPPILPVLLDSSVEKCLPTGSDWLKVLFNAKLRASLGENPQKAFGGVAKLLTESGGHPRRVEALIANGNAISKSVREAESKASDRNTTCPSDGEILMAQLQALKSKKGKIRCLGAMNGKLNLRSLGEDLSTWVPNARKKYKMILASELLAVVSGEKTCLQAMKGVSNRSLREILSKFVPTGKVEYTRDEIILVLLKNLFKEVDMDDPEAKILRSATTVHYQLVPCGSNCYVGYLPLPALQSFCDELQDSHSQEYASYLVHAKGAADANLSTSDTTLDEEARSNAFEMSMFHALCGAVLARESVTEDMFRHSPDNLPKTRCTEIEWAKDVVLFPSAVENGATLRVCDDKTLHRICEVGAFNEEGNKQWKGLAFVPTDEGNTCCDFVLVLPTADQKRAGRVVFAVQCKHWAKDVMGKDGLDALAYFRYGRHCFEAEKVFVQKEGGAKRYAHSWRLSVSQTTCLFHSVENSFRDKFCKIVEQQNKDSDTRVVFVLATANDIMQASVKASVFNEVNLPGEGDYKSPTLLRDEGLMDLQHMCDWCPTVGHGALLAEKLQQFSIVPDKQANDTNTKE